MSREGEESQHICVSLQASPCIAGARPRGSHHHSALSTPGGEGTGLLIYQPLVSLWG